MAVALAGTCGIYGASTLHADAPTAVPGDTRPHPLWSPPTRAQMLAALKASSAQSLRPSASRDLDNSTSNTSLQTPEKNAASTSPSPAAHEHSGGLPVARSGDEDGEGFDLLIVGGGATGAGVAVDAATRGLSVAMIERDDFGAGEPKKRE